MNQKELIEKHYFNTLLKSMPLQFRVFYWMGISDMILVKNGNNTRFWNYKIRLFNWFHPLSYVIFIPMFLISIFIYGIGDSLKEAIKSFSYR